SGWSESSPSLQHLAPRQGRVPDEWRWVEVETGDYMSLRAFCPQACYAGGPENFRYLLYKDQNRQITL
ncbi:MAG: hypothetical protein ACTIK1_13030, partial [Glutamicibacter arilaitensis]